MKHSSMFVLLALLLVALLAVPVMAQEDEATEAPVIVVPVEGDETDETPVDAGDVVLSVYTILGIVLSSVIAGGALGVAGVGLIARRILSDPSGVAAVEKLGDSVPAETAAAILDFAGAVIDVANLLKEALDRVPAAEKPLPPEVAQG